jgi:hypothetical protein
MVGAYLGANRPTTFACDSGHEWQGTPSNVMRGSGCPRCAKYGFDVKRPAVAYYIRVTSAHGTLYKIGATNRAVEARFQPTELKQIEVLMTWEFETGAQALDFERKILQKYAQYRWQGPPVLRIGNTELFDRDVMALYLKEII